MRRGLFFLLCCMGLPATESISTWALKPASVGRPHQQILHATAIAGPMTWSIVSGTLPVGITLDLATGVLSGSPERPGTCEIQVQVSHGDGTSDPRRLRLIVQEPGAVLAWGSDPIGVERLKVPSGLQAVAIAVGNRHILALGTDGSPIIWGASAPAPPADATDLSSISAGDNHFLALTADGRVQAWGDNADNQCMVPTGLTSVVAIAAGQRHSVVLTDDGRVHAWGSDEFGQSTVPDEAREVVAIAAGGSHTLALKADGTVLAWGANAHGQTTVPSTAVGVTAIAAGTAHSVALTTSGAVLAWGYNQTTWRVPASARGTLAIAAGGYNSMAIRPDGSSVVWGYDREGTTSAPRIGPLSSAIAVGGNCAATVCQFISTCAVQPACQGRSYRQPLHVFGGPATGWVLRSGTLPEGLSLDGTTGEIHGTSISGNTALSHSGRGGGVS